jgi:hypothetical protein
MLRGANLETLAVRRAGQVLAEGQDLGWSCVTGRHDLDLGNAPARLERYWLSATPMPSVNKGQGGRRHLDVVHLVAFEVRRSRRGRQFTVNHRSSETPARRDRDIRVSYSCVRVRPLVTSEIEHSGEGGARSTTVAALFDEPLTHPGS